MPNPKGNNVLISTGIWFLLFHDTTFVVQMHVIGLFSASHKPIHPGAFQYLETDCSKRYRRHISRPRYMRELKIG